MVEKESLIRSVADLKDTKIALPEAGSFTSRVCLAELRDRGVDPKKLKITYVREQGAVAFWVENRFAELGGLASYSGVAQSWSKDGGRVIHRSASQPYFPLIAGKRITGAQTEAIQQALLKLPGQDPEKVLNAIGIQEFDITTAQRLQALLDWLGN